MAKDNSHLDCYLFLVAKAGASAGLNLNFHGDELNYVGAGELGGELGALAISHLEEVSEEGILAMAKRPTFGNELEMRSGL